MFGELSEQMVRSLARNRDLKGVNTPVKFGERTRNCSPGQAGKEGPPSLLDGGILWFFSNCGASVGFLTRYDGVLREPLVWY